MGAVVTYEDNPLAHIKTEFAFDVLQVAKGRYASESYHNFVGFEVSLPLARESFPGNLRHRPQIGPQGRRSRRQFLSLQRQHVDSQGLSRGLELEAERH